MVDNVTTDVPTASASLQSKKKSSAIRDVYKIYRSVLKLWHRDKHKEASPSREAESRSKLKWKTKKYKSLQKPDRNIDAEASEGSGDSMCEEGVNLYRVQSYRCNGNNNDKSHGETLKPLSRSLSKGATPAQRPSFGRSMSTNRVDSPQSVLRNFSRSSSVKVGPSTATPILFSSSSCTTIKPPPTEKELECTLEELCTGCTKKIKITRDVFTSAGRGRQEEEMLKIKVKPGWKNGTKVTFDGKGIEATGTLPADLVFVIIEKEHELYRRERDDLETEVEIPLVDALTGSNLSISLPDGETMRLSIDDVIHPNYVKVIEGRGMPDPKDEGKRGDLRIRFQIKFPTDLTEEQQEDIRSILEDST